MLDAHFESVLVLATLAGFAVVEFLRREPWIVRSFDRGGLRVRNLLTGARRYLPFSAIASIDVERGNAVVLKDRRGGVMMRVFHRSPAACGKTLSELPRLAGRPLGACAALARGGLDLDAWLLRVRTLATQRGPYRGTDLEPEQVLEVARAEQAPLGERAAALYFLSCLGQRPTEFFSSLDEESPPLMVVVAALAPGGEELLPLAEDLVRYLPLADRAAFDRARSVEPPSARIPRTT